MPQKRRLQDPPPSAPAPASASTSSSTEDDLEESDNDAVEQEANGVSRALEFEKSDDDDDEEDDRLNITKSSALNHGSKASKRRSSSDSGDGSSDESDSDTDSDKSMPSPSVMDFTIKPVVVSKPMKDSAKPNKSSAKHSSSKRANESNEEEKESKKMKKVSNGQDEDVKKGCTQRLWNEEDEIAILKGFIDYQSKKGTDPGADMLLFHEYIKNNLHAEVSKIQLSSKLRNLKKKFLRNIEKVENGKDLAFSKPVDHKIFELSKKVWGSAATANGVDKRKTPQSKGKNLLALPAPKLEMDEKDEEPNGEMNPEPSNSRSNSSLLRMLLSHENLMVPESAMSILKEATPLIGSSKVKELERKLKKLQEEELQLYMKKVVLVHETAKVVKIRQATESCLLGGAFASSSWEQMQLQPPSKLARTCARPKSAAAPNPSRKASWLGSLHSNIHNLNSNSRLSFNFKHKHTLFCSVSALMPRNPAPTSMTMIKTHRKMPNPLAISRRSFFFPPLSSSALLATKFQEEI
ncbi:STOREKEEPER protein-like [Senna tora]|uniref:STOREKEEPER protein-like n=1 Tax=Senna tora TaxID=362788 RepID=A0A834WN90_9FABA|nr:STOREKEEPER protein-like [Senna tora]